MQYCIVPVTFLHQNCLIIWCDITRDAALVDPGGDVFILKSVVTNLAVNIKKILLTHGHVDHVGGAMELQGYYNIPIFGPNKADQSLLNNLCLQYSMLGISNIKPDHDSIVVPDFWLEDGDIVKVGYEILHILHCPGHSPGHIVYWNKIKKFIIMGDVLFKGSIGRTDFPGGNGKVLVNSIKTKLFPLGDDITFVPGHGVSSTLGYERFNNIFVT